MVDRTDIPQINTLMQRYRGYQDALAVFDHDAKIVSFTLQGTTAGDAEDGQWPTATVDAEGIQSPPQMLTAIKDQIETRIKEINDQLTGMGVSESSSRQAPQTPVSTSGGAESRPTTQKPASEPPKPASTAPKPSTSHSRGRR